MNVPTIPPFTTQNFSCSILNLSCADDSRLNYQAQVKLIRVMPSQDQMRSSTFTDFVLYTWQFSMAVWHGIILPINTKKICPNAILNLYGLHGISTGFFHGIRSFMDLYGTELWCQLVPKFTFRRPTLSTKSRERTEGNILFFENEQQTRSILAQLILTIAPLFRQCHRGGYYCFRLRRPRLWSWFPRGPLALPRRWRPGHS